MDAVLHAALKMTLQLTILLLTILPLNAPIAMDAIRTQLEAQAVHISWGVLAFLPTIALRLEFPECAANRVMFGNSSVHQADLSFTLEYHVTPEEFVERITAFPMIAHLLLNRLMMYHCLWTLPGGVTTQTKESTQTNGVLLQEKTRLMDPLSDTTLAWIERISQSGDVTKTTDHIVGK